MPLILALDQGTTSTRALLLECGAAPARVLASAQKELTQHYPQDGWVEHDAGEIWQQTQQVIAQVIQEAGINAAQIKAMGITNQRETTVLWDRATGQPVYNAIVWQDRRTAAAMEALQHKGDEPWLQEKTGLLADPYFSASKLYWLLEKVPGLRARAQAGELAFGTIDSWLVYKLTGGKVHATDATNASRTLLFNIHTQAWDSELLAYFTVPPEVLPQVLDSAADYGLCEAGLFGAAIPIRAVAGDQQAAAVGQLCLAAGEAKCTFGTGAFLLVHTGDRALTSRHRLLTTVALRIGGQVTYALEGSIFSAGSAIQWLRDGLHAAPTASAIADLAAQVPTSAGVVMIPAFTGLGAPHWNARVRGALLGLTRDTTLAHIAKATQESIAYQVQDLIAALRADLQDGGQADITSIRVDGGVSRNTSILQHLANLTGVPIERPQLLETTALGVAFLAQIGAGLARWHDLPAQRAVESTLLPQADDSLQRWRSEWQPAVAQLLRA